METTELETLMKDYKNLEKQSHIVIDDVLNKINQETSELLEAYQNNDTDEMNGEACDVIINVLSVAVDLWIDIECFDKQTNTREINPLSLAIEQGLWNQKIQSLRWRYSRENITLQEAQNITISLIMNVLDYTELNLSEVIQKNTHKFRSRQWRYTNDIDLKDSIWEYKDFPKKGINFKDISPILDSPDLLRYTCMELAKHCSNSDVIVWLDSRGFLFWPMVAQYLWKPFVMARKAGKIPWETTRRAYGLEYGKDILEMQNDSIKPGEKVSIIDDLLATWGTVGAAIDLIEGYGGEVNNISFVISLDENELIDMDSRKQLFKYPVNSVVSYTS